MFMRSFGPLDKGDQVEGELMFEAPGISTGSREAPCPNCRNFAESIRQKGR